MPGSGPSCWPRESPSARTTCSSLPPPSPPASRWLPATCGASLGSPASRSSTGRPESVLDPLLGRPGAQGLHDLLVEAILLRARLRQVILALLLEGADLRLE